MVKKSKDILDIHEKIKYQVIQSNSLIQDYTNDLNLNEKKLFLLAISKIRKDDNLDTLYTISFQEYCDLTGLSKSGSLYTLLKNGMEKILNNSFWLYDKERNGQNKLILFSHLFIGQGFVEFKFNEESKKLLFNLKEYFTTFELWNTLSLSNINSINMYEFLKSYSNQQTLEISVANLKKKLNVNYEKYSDFKRYVLKKSVDEINEKTDLEITFNEIKKGRKIDKIVFTIDSKDFKGRNINFNNYEKNLLDI